MRRTLAFACLAALVVAGCDRMQGDPPPRHFMQGGMLLPTAAGYWFHQYAVNDDVERLAQALRFACTETTGNDGSRMRCERGFRMPGGLLSRTDYVELALRRNGAIASAESGCRYAFLDSEKLSGACDTFAAKGAVYPDVGSFAAMSEAMLRATPIHQPTSVYRLPPGANAPLPDAGAAVDRLARWRYECETPTQRYTVGFRGNAGEILELRCQQWSLRTPEGKPQSQQIVVRYDTADLAVLGVTARLDDVALPLSPLLNTPRDAGARGADSARATGAPTSLALVTVAGERFEMPMSAVGTGSHQATRDGFVALTPDSQRRLVQAYLDKQSRQWGGRLERLSHAYLGSLEWFGPEAVPHLDALVSDENPELGAAIVKHRCFESVLRESTVVDDRTARSMATCIDERRGALPRSLATMDRLLAQDMRVHSGSTAPALNAFLDFRRDVIYVYALGPDGKASATALEETVQGKEGLDADLTRLVAAAIAQHDRPLQQR